MLTGLIKYLRSAILRALIGRRRIKVISLRFVERLNVHINKLFKICQEHIVIRHTFKQLLVAVITDYYHVRRNHINTVTDLAPLVYLLRKEIKSPLNVRKVHQLLLVSQKN